MPCEKQDPGDAVDAGQEHHNKRYICDMDDTVQFYW